MATGSGAAYCCFLFVYVFATTRYDNGVTEIRVFTYVIILSSRMMVAAGIRSITAESDNVLSLLAHIWFRMKFIF